MYSGQGNTPSRVLGFPIRTSADQHLVDSSPQLFAVTHVLHRFLAPRHPPLALYSLNKQRCSCLLCSSQRASPASGSCEHAHRTRRGSGADAHAMREGQPFRVDSLKTEEKTMPAVGRTHREGPNPSTHARLTRQTHQCTNRCVSHSDRTNVDHRVEKHSLERR